MPYEIGDELIDCDCCGGEGWHDPEGDDAQMCGSCDGQGWVDPEDIQVLCDAR